MNLRHIGSPGSIAAILCLSSFLSPASLAAQQEQPIEPYLSAIRVFAEHSQAGRCSEVVKDGPSLATDARFSRIRHDYQVGILAILVRCAIEVRDARLAFDTLGRLAPLGREDHLPWQLRLLFAIELEEPQAGVESFRKLAELSPASVSEIETRLIGQLLRQARSLDSDGALRFEMHEILDRVNYRSPDPLDSLDRLRIEHARGLLQRGRVADARRRIEGVTALEAHFILWAERTFDPLRKSPDPPDLKSVAEKEIANAVAAVKAHPGQLKARFQLVRAYRQAGRPEDTLAAADAAVADVASGAAQYEDASEYLKWVHTYRVNALYELGRNEAGRAAMRTGIAAREGEPHDVSQVINFSILLLDERRAEEALAALQKMDEPSPFGRMFAEMVRACAAAQTGDAAALADALAYLRAHEQDNIFALQRGLLCADAADEAAALYVKRLADPDLRQEALIALQNWQEDPADLPFRKEINRRLAALRNRRDVLEAIAEVGRVLDLPFVRSHWGNF